MWQCGKCREQVEDNFDVCWNCGISREGVEDPGFQREGGGDTEVRRDAAPPPGRKKARHQFTESQRAQIGSLAVWMQAASFILLLGVVLSGVVAPDWTGLIPCVLWLVLALFTWGAAISFQQFVDTEGQDLDSLMVALNELRKLFMLQVLLTLLGAALIGVVFLVLQTREFSPYVWYNIALGTAGLLLLLLLWAARKGKQAKGDRKIAGR